jgi:sugar phosphate isomerase/epimerase
VDIYISSSVNKKLEQAVKFASDNNFNLEISRFGSMTTLDKEFEERLSWYKSILKNFKGKLSVHGFFFDLNPSTPDPEILKLTEHRYNQSFEIARELKANTVVFHSGYNSLIKHPDYNRDFINYQVDFWNYFIKRFEDEGMTVAMENTYEFTPDILIKLVDTINSDSLKLCIDTGHTNINAAVGIPEWIERIDNRLHHIHLHNNFGNSDAHSSLLNGNIDFKAVFSKLSEKNLSPNLVLEIFTEQEILESYDLLRQLQRLKIPPYELQQG